ELGAGSRFAFALEFPLASEQAAAAASSLAAADDTVSRLRARGTHVLVAEDTAVNRVLVHKMLELLGCRVTAVVKAQDGGELLGHEDVCALSLMDVHMPVLTGLEAPERVRVGEATHAGARRTPTVASTASAFAEEAPRCKQAGMDGILNKPM